MKNLVFGIIAILFSINSQAQNKNVKSEVQTTVTTVNDSDGEKKTVTTQEVHELQNIELMDANTTVLNKETKETPVQVTKTTKIAENGVTKVIDVDRSAYYDLNGVKYQVVADKKGYTMYFPKGIEAAILRKTSNNNYIYKTKNNTSFGYFDADGNLILETYNDKTDKVTVTKYDIIQK
ncbi:hypothetical protein [Flavobacterium cellulosilyticum]|uniref:WG repeat-containing protein n=1 Tax=Flavobacterium cellulosilyticum TaxID=2541731 RepID=A0A4R5CEU6_9FLAO|nr:hypothetical protein [Flavobacterium cellulosilyticum]TDD97446.1 hypothetical protein E0F76_09065 [Flavobacterium cellulosilyticum]